MLLSKSIPANRLRQVFRHNEPSILTSLGSSLNLNSMIESMQLFSQIELGPSRVIKYLMLFFQVDVRLSRSVSLMVSASG